jgi:hypothetical protein
VIWIERTLKRAMKPGDEKAATGAFGAAADGTAAAATVLSP